MTEFDKIIFIINKMEKAKNKEQTDKHWTKALETPLWRTLNETTDSTRVIRTKRKLN